MTERERFAYDRARDREAWTFVTLTTLVVTAIGLIVRYILYRRTAVGFRLRGERAFRASRFDKALILLNQAVGLDPNDAATFALRARLRLLTGQVNAAFTDSCEALRLSPGHPEYYLIRTAIRIAQKDRSGAEVDCDQAISLDARCGQAFLVRAGLKEDRGDLEGSISDLTEALKIGTSDDRIVIRRGFNYLSTGFPEKAWDDFEEGLRLHPRSAEAHMGKAIVLGEGGKLNRAREEVDMAMECCLPDDPLRNRLTELRERFRGDS